MPKKRKGPQVVWTPVAMTEVDRKFYELEIEDRKSKIYRMECLIEELEEQEIEKEFTLKTSESLSSEIKQLRRTLAEKYEEMNSIQKFVTEKNTVFNNEIKNQEIKIEQLDKEFHEEKYNFMCQYKAISAKCNLLEEFNKVYNKIIIQYDEREEYMKEKEESHKRNMELTEEGYESIKKNLIYNTEKRLFHVSKAFQRKIFSFKVHHTIARTIRENVRVNNEIDFLTNSQIKLENDLEYFTCETERLTNLSLLRREDINGKMRAVLVQNNVIKGLKERKNLWYQNRPINKKCVTFKTNIDFQNLTYVLKTLHQNLNRLKSDRASLEFQANTNEKKLEQLQRYLFEALYFTEIEFDKYRDDKIQLRQVLKDLKAYFTRSATPSFLSVSTIKSARVDEDLHVSSKDLLARPEFKFYRSMGIQTDFARISEVTSKISNDIIEIIPEKESVASHVSKEEERFFRDDFSEIISEIEEDNSDSLTEEMSILFLL